MQDIDWPRWWWTSARFLQKQKCEEALWLIGWHMLLDLKIWVGDGTTKNDQRTWCAKAHQSASPRLRYTENTQSDSAKIPIESQLTWMLLFLSLACITFQSKYNVLLCVINETEWDSVSVEPPFRASAVRQPYISSICTFCWIVSGSAKPKAWLGPGRVKDILLRGHSIYRFGRNLQEPGFCFKRDVMGLGKESHTSLIRSWDDSSNNVVSVTNV